MMEVTNLSFKAKGGKRLLLEQINARFQPGSFWGILGANGAGKSTLLKLLSGEHRPTSGSISFHGQELWKYKRADLAQKRAVLAQQNAVNLDFTVQEIVGMGRYPYYSSHPSQLDQSIIRSAMQKVKVDGLSERQYPTLSGGEQQRVQLARALAQIWDVNQAFLLLDEPTTGMDLRHQYDTFLLAREMSQKGAGVIAVVHDLNLASQFTDQILLLKDGRVEDFGPTQQILTEENIEKVFGLPVRVVHLEPDMNKAMIVPQIKNIASQGN
ncbi:heme ABC transporter ATP-binding protein [Dyadobacter tibetensis]|uniref:heme ABC transporter ATP-binding protein n=1 Tax=Dyadobacter tibetensis TaxID=1211851 RepID=UPI00046F2C03|nr:heme ABC transporter ATP-binding protein [Dyadobacter tibetensis]